MPQCTSESPTASKPHTDFVEVLLSQGKVALIDSADAERVCAFKWCAVCTSPRRKRARWYGYRRDYSVTPSKGIYLHRFIVDAPQGVEVDHWNGDGLDCRRANLRLATRSQNAQNIRVIRGTVPFRGVHAVRSWWRAEINCKGVTHRSRLFDSAEEAARAYDVLSRKLHGEFGVRNFPDDPDQFTAEYVLDRRAGRKTRFGEDHPKSRFTEEQVRAIRRRVDGGETQASLARELGVRPSVINGIVKRTRWTYLNDEVAA